MVKGQGRMEWRWRGWNRGRWGEGGLCPGGVRHGGGLCHILTSFPGLKALHGTTETIISSLTTADPSSPTGQV